ncbi:hypothetical protein QCA50_008293 [Cerrena zonata]|uniref:Uncharacterized protein n=1 Tax=Cerrena zonata TaxID=2478898 RepID=A0AAW0GAW4_9APHY
MSHLEALYFFRASSAPSDQLPSRLVPEGPVAFARHVVCLSSSIGLVSRTLCISPYLHTIRYCTESPYHSSMSNSPQLVHGMPGLCLGRDIRASRNTMIWPTMMYSVILITSSSYRPLIDGDERVPHVPHQSMYLAYFLCHKMDEASILGSHTTSSHVPAHFRI